MPRITSGLLVMLVITTITITNAHAGPRDALGARIGYGPDQDQFYLGGQAELGPVIGAAFFLPSLDVGLGDNSLTMFNADLRWYLLPLPETAIYFYGSAGPTLILSPGSELGLSLVVGVDIPMKARNRYNLELRFGVGDIPDLKLMLGVLFDL